MASLKCRCGKVFQRPLTQEDMAMLGEPHVVLCHDCELSPTIPERGQMTTDDRPLDEKTENAAWAFRWASKTRDTEEALAALRSRIRELVEEARKETEARADESFMRVISDA